MRIWSVSCYICRDVAKQVAQWCVRFGGEVLKVIAIHQPRGPEELDIARVTVDALGSMGRVQPCGVAHEHTLVELLQNQFVPAWYVFNRKNELRHFKPVTRPTIAS